MVGQSQTIEPRGRRTRNHWEAMYDPNFDTKLVAGSWNFTHDSGHTRKVFLAKDLIDDQKKTEYKQSKRSKF